MPSQVTFHSSWPGHRALHVVLHYFLAFLCACNRWCACVVGDDDDDDGSAHKIEVR